MLLYYLVILCGAGGAEPVLQPHEELGIGRLGRADVEMFVVPELRTVVRNYCRYNLSHPTHRSTVLAVSELLLERGDIQRDTLEASIAFFDRDCASTRYQTSCVTADAFRALRTVEDVDRRLLGVERSFLQTSPTPTRVWTIFSESIRAARQIVELAGIWLATPFVGLRHALYRAATSILEVWANIPDHSRSSLAALSVVDALYETYRPTMTLLPEVCQSLYVRTDLIGREIQRCDRFSEIVPNVIWSR